MGVGSPPPRFLREVVRFAGPYWNAPHRAKVRGATALLLLLTVGQVGLAVWTTYWLRDLFDALERRDLAAVLTEVVVFALIFVLTVAVTGAHLLVKRWLQLDWRRWLTADLAGRWLDKGRHYRLGFRPGEHDNPDGRIAEDIRIATEVTVALAHTLVYSLLSFFLFVGILWEVSGALRIPGTSLEIPGYMVPLAFLYAGIGAILGWGFGRPLVRATNSLQTAEADFRFQLARARERSERIALTRGEAVEREGATRRFVRIVRDWNRQSLAYMGIVGFSTGYNALLPVFPILVAAPQYMAGTMTLGVLMQAAQAFQKVASALSWLTDNLGEIARTRASADRVLALHESMRQLDADDRRPDAEHIVLEQSGGDGLHVEGLRIEEPAGRVLLDGLSLRIARGERVLVTGDAAAAGSLFQVLGGLWPWGSGHVRLPDAGILFLPHRPFLPEGPLREVLGYPLPGDAFDPAQMQRALERAELRRFAARLEDEDDWERALPLRVQHRLALARAFLHHPEWIVIEEATDVFDPQSERWVLEALHEELPRTGVLAISLYRGHDGLYDRRVLLAHGPASVAGVPESGRRSAAQ